jgi:PIN domain nuclease of toxin-antitoxin system
MIAAVADTHTALRYLFNDSRLSGAAGDFIEQVAADGKRIAVSVISMAEIVLSHRERPAAGQRLR